MSSMFSRSTCILAVLLAIPGGLVGSVSVAWYASFVGQQPRTVSGAHWTVYSVRTDSGLWIGQSLRDWGHCVLDEGLDVVPYHEVDVSGTLPYWAHGPPSDDMPWRVQFAAGWPCLCFTGAEVPLGSSSELRGALHTSYGAMPFRPIWAGLLVNSVFFGGCALITMLMLRLGIESWLRSYRKKCDRCEGCGYPLKGSGERCPECARLIRRVS